MLGCRFLDVAKSLVPTRDEARRRAAIIHAYYALVLECRDALVRWGRTLPPRAAIHASVRLNFVYSTDPDMRIIADALDRLVRLRNQASYDLTHHSDFASDNVARESMESSSRSIAVLDSIEQDGMRRAAVIDSLPD